MQGSRNNHTQLHIIRERTRDHRQSSVSVTIDQSGVPVACTHYGVLLFTNDRFVQRTGQDGVVAPREVISAPVDVAVNGQHVMVVFR